MPASSPSTIGRFRYIAWVKCPYRVAGKASALSAGSDIPKSAYSDPCFLCYMASHSEASIIGQALGHGVTRSKRQALEWKRKAAENGDAAACLQLAGSMYGDYPYAREAGHVGDPRVRDTAGSATLAWVTDSEGHEDSAAVLHDLPTDVLTSVVHWLQKGGHDILSGLDTLRGLALDGANYCFNEGCEVVGHLKEFKVCPQCKFARYCGDACQKEDWTAGGHKERCGTTQQGSAASRRLERHVGSGRGLHLSTFQLNLRGS